MTSPRHIHIVGAGLAGLSAALQLSLMGEKVSLYEANPWAGGRARSYTDSELGCLIDNGSHLVFSGNVAVEDYLFLSGATDTMTGPTEPIFPFMDMKTNERWTVHMSKGRMPWWLFDPKRRIEGTTTRDYLEALKLLFADEKDTVGDLFDKNSKLYHRFWEPLTISALNTEMENASAQLLYNLFIQSFGAGGAACLPRFPKIGLSESFVTPCLETLKKNNVNLHLNCRLSGLVTENQTVKALDFRGKKIELGPSDWLILATPAWMTAGLVPGLQVPTSFRGIGNVHYRLEAPANLAGFTGLVGGLAEWVFVKQGVVSVTISVLDRYREPDTTSLGVQVWRDLAKLFDLDPEKVPPFRIVRERRATIASTPEQNLLRPRSYIGWKNLALAGDWTDTGLPSCIEGTLRSGVKAAQVVRRWSA